MLASSADEQEPISDVIPKLVTPPSDDHRLELRDLVIAQIEEDAPPLVTSARRLQRERGILLGHVTRDRNFRTSPKISNGMPVVPPEKEADIEPRRYARLERFARRATHGPTASAVMTHFIESGMRDAVERGYIRLEDDQ